MVISMMDVLAQVESALPQLLRTPGWESVFVDYHKPFVERIWRKYGDYRINLHRIFPCAAEESLFHPHPWPSVMRILQGHYEMGLGYGKGMVAPPMACVLRSKGDFIYEMNDPDGWHYVRPITEPVFSLMVSGKPWDREAPKSETRLRPLAQAVENDLLAFFMQRYCKR
jgi:hypothetical protein